MNLSKPLEWRLVTVKIRSCTVQNGAELGVLGDEYNSPRGGKGHPDCSETKLTVRLYPRESKSESRMRTEMHKTWGKYFRGCSRTVSFVFPYIIRRTYLVLGTSVLSFY